MQAPSRRDSHHADRILDGGRNTVTLCSHVANGLQLAICIIMTVMTVNNMQAAARLYMCSHCMQDCACAVHACTGAVLEQYWSSNGAVHACTWAVLEQYMLVLEQYWSSNRSCFMRHHGHILALLSVPGSQQKPFSCPSPSLVASCKVRSWTILLVLPLAVPHSGL